MAHRSGPRRNAVALRLAAAAALAALSLAPAAAKAGESSGSQDKKTWLVAAREADLVVTGTLTGLESRWAGKKIVTDANFTVDTLLKGDAAGGEPVVRVTVMGGRVERPVPVAMVVADAPSFAENEEALLFLRHGEDGGFTVVKKLPVHKDAESGTKTVTLGHRSVPVEALARKKQSFEERAERKTPPAERPRR